MSESRRSLATAIGVCVLIALLVFGCQRNLLYFPDKAALARVIGEKLAEKKQKPA